MNGSIYMNVHDRDNLIRRLTQARRVNRRIQRNLANMRIDALLDEISNCSPRAVSSLAVRHAGIEIEAARTLGGRHF